MLVRMIMCYMPSMQRQEGFFGHIRTGNFVSSSPAVVNGVLYVGSEDDKLYALDARNGKTLWVSFS